MFATGKITGNQDTEEFYHSMGGGWGGVWGWNGWSWSQGYGGSAGPVGLGSVTTQKVTKHKKGNLEIDIFETSSKDLVWRGLASGKTKGPADGACDDVCGFSAEAGSACGAGGYAAAGRTVGEALQRCGVVRGQGATGLKGATGFGSGASDQRTTMERGPTR